VYKGFTARAMCEYDGFEPHVDPLGREALEGSAIGRRAGHHYDLVPFKLNLAYKGMPSVLAKL
jgi:hypothetical protein